MNRQNNIYNQDDNYQLNRRSDRLGDLYSYIDTWNGERLFTYIVVTIFILWLFTRVILSLSVLIGLIVASFVVSYLNNRVIVNEDTYRENQQIKIETLQPIIKHSPSSSLTEHDNVVNMLFSIRDLYMYNPQQYIEMTRKINMFFQLYDLCLINASLANTYYDMMKQFKRDALNALSSMIFSIPDDVRVRNKIDNATIVLDDIMTTYLDQISYLSDEQIYKYGYNTDTLILDYGPTAFNSFDDAFKPYSYEIF